jgi:hypothetical protein
VFVDRTECDLVELLPRAAPRKADPKARTIRNLNGRPGRWKIFDRIAIAKTPFTLLLKEDHIPCETTSEDFY